MKPNPWVFILFSLAMGIVIMVLPYIVALFSHFNKERLVVWRRFLIIVSVCYIPLIAILYAFCVTSPTDIIQIFLPLWWKVGYFGYITLAVFVKKRTNLQLGWLKFIIFATAGYLMATILLIGIFILFDDPLINLFIGASVNY